MHEFKNTKNEFVLDPVVRDVNLRPNKSKIKINSKYKRRFQSVYYTFIFFFFWFNSGPDDSDVAWM